MEPGEVEEQRSAVPVLNLTTTAGGAFNEISLEERKERIRLLDCEPLYYILDTVTTFLFSGILAEILSIPRLVEANLTQRSLAAGGQAVGRLLGSGGDTGRNTRYV